MILPVTGVRLDAAEKLANIDHGIDWALAWGDRREAHRCRGRPSDQAGACSRAHSKTPAQACCGGLREAGARARAQTSTISSRASPSLAAGACSLIATASIMRRERSPRSLFPAFDASGMTTIDLAELINDPGTRNRKICCPFHDERHRACTSTQITTTASAAAPTATTLIG